MITPILGAVVEIHYLNPYLLQDDSPYRLISGHESMMHNVGSAAATVLHLLFWS